MTIQEFFNSLGYFELRSLITNALHNRETNSPFTKAEIINYAKEEAENSIFTASYSALEGYDNDILFIGKPATDPVTGETNSLADQSGILDKVSESVNNSFLKIGIAVFISAVIYKKYIK